MCSDSHSIARSPGQELSDGSEAFYPSVPSSLLATLVFTDEFMEYLGFRGMLSDFGFSGQYSLSGSLKLRRL